MAQQKECGVGPCYIQVQNNMDHVVGRAHVVKDHVRKLLVQSEGERKSGSYAFLPEIVKI